MYDRCGLLTPRTVLGHCLHLSDREIAVLAERGAKVAHCPTANFFLTSGLLPMDRLRAAGIGIGLGSDVGAGTELNLWQVMRAAVETQKARSYYEPGTPLLQPAEAFHLATQGGAEVMGLGQIVGTLERRQGGRPARAGPREARPLRRSGRIGAGRIGVAVRVPRQPARDRRQLRARAAGVRASLTVQHIDLARRLDDRSLFYMLEAFVIYVPRRESF